MIKKAMLFLQPSVHPRDSDLRSALLRLLCSSFSSSCVEVEPDFKCRQEPSVECTVDLHGLDQRGIENAFAAVLRKCSSLSEGRRVHLEVIRAGYDGNRYLGNLLVQMYGNCGSLQEARMAFQGISKQNAYSWNLLIVAYAHNGHLEEARSAFDKMPVQNNITWNGMIAGYAHNGYLKEARSLFDSLPVKDVVSLNIMVTAYAQNGDLQEAKRMFDRIPVSELNTVSWNNMLTAYAQNGHLGDAKALFDRMPERNAASWNGLITTYIQRDNAVAAIHLFRLMKQDGIQPDRITFICIADACASISLLAEAKVLHSCIAEGEYESDVKVGTGLVNMFTKCGSLEDAKIMFDKMPEKNTISWTNMITAYAQDGRAEEARTMFDRMPRQDVVSWTTMIAAYAQNGHLQEARGLFDRMSERDIVTWNTMIVSYSQNRHLQEAWSLLEEMPIREVTSWTGLISGYAQAGHGKEALQLFKKMDLEGFEPHEITFVSALDACASSAAVVEGKSIQEDAIVRGFETETVVGSALVNMLGKCGHLEEARSLFHRMPQPNVVTWTAIIAAHARSGKGNIALELFNLMDLKGEQPNWITFATILSACSHGGLLEDARNYFLRMLGDYCIAPVVDHYICLVDLCGRSGQLDNMEDLINNMPFEADEVAWTAMLGACRLHGDAQRGARIAKHVLDSNRGSAPYVLLANLYSTGIIQD